MEKYILTLSCPDRLGVVAAVSGFLADNDGFILESHHFGDISTGKFFMRSLFVPGEDSPSKKELEGKFQIIANQFNMNWKLTLKSYKTRVMIMVSQQGHCLNALLNKMQMGDLAIEVPLIVSNHPELQKMADRYETPYHYLPITPESKPEQEHKVLDLIKEHSIDLVILARYMQILTGNFVEKMPGKIINIHHSFLPSFKGARPYHQAFDHGVKLIGATAHYVSEILDEGPIIEQEVTRVDHNCQIEELVALGQDIESIALTKAVKWHTEQRIFLNGKKTVVFK